MLELWTQGVLTPAGAGVIAERAEEAGWAGLAAVDSQNLAGDCYVGLALAANATQRLRLATSVTNPVTRHPAVTASAIASVQAASGGRAVLGIGRGDSALAHLGRAPARVALFERYLRALQEYLSGRSVRFEDLDFHEALAPPVDELGLSDNVRDSRLHWLPADLPKVPLEVAATGPKVIAAAARVADRITFAVGADVERLGWAIESARAARATSGSSPEDLSFGAYVNLVCHRDLDKARELVAGGLTTFARFSVMHGKTLGPTNDEQAEVFRRIHEAYDMREHTRADSQHATVLTPSFVDGYAIVGDPDRCIARLRALQQLGVEKVVVTGATFGADRNEAKVAQRLLVDEVLPVFAASSD